MSETPSAPQPPAGWYPDPIEPSVVRWWDGSEWTHHLQPAPQPETATARPPWLTNRAAVGAVLGLILILTVLFLVVGGGGEDNGGTEPAEDLSPTEAAQLDAEAQAAARTAQAAVETYATDNQGEYAGASPEALGEIEPTLSAEGVTVEAEAKSYLVSAESESGTTFSIARTPDATITLTCDAPGEGGCPPSGDWSF